MADSDSDVDIASEQLYADEGTDYSWINELYSSDSTATNKLQFKQRVLIECESIARNFFLARLNLYGRCLFHDIFIGLFEDDRSDRITSIIDTLLRNVYANSIAESSSSGGEKGSGAISLGSRNKVISIDIDNISTLRDPDNFITMASFVSNWTRFNREGCYPHLNAKVRAALLLRFGDNYIDSILAKVIKNRPTVGREEVGVGIDWSSYDYLDPSFDSSISGRLNYALLLHFLVKYDTINRVFELQFLKAYKITENIRNKPTRTEVMRQVMGKIGLVGVSTAALECVRISALLCEGAITVSDINGYFEHIGTHSSSFMFKDLCTLGTLHAYCKRRLSDDGSRRLINILFANGLFSLSDFDAEVAEALVKRVLTQAIPAGGAGGGVVAAGKGETENLCSRVKKRLLDGSSSGVVDRFNAVKLVDLLLSESRAFNGLHEHRVGDALLMYLCSTFARSAVTFSHSDKTSFLGVALGDLEAFCYPNGLAVRCRFYPEIGLPPYKLSLSPFDSTESLYKQVINQAFTNLKKVAIAARSGFVEDLAILNVKIPFDIAIFAEIQLRTQIKKSNKSLICSYINNGQKVYIASQYLLSFFRGIGHGPGRLNHRTPLFRDGAEDNSDNENDSRHKTLNSLNEDAAAGRSEAQFQVDRPSRRKKAHVVEEDPEEKLRVLERVIRRDIVRANSHQRSKGTAITVLKTKKPFPGVLADAHKWPPKLLRRYLTDELELAEMDYLFQYLDWSGSEFMLIGESFTDDCRKSSNCNDNNDDDDDDDSDDNNSISSDVSNSSKTNNVAYYCDTYRNETISGFFSALQRESREMKNVSEIVVFKLINSSKKLLLLNLKEAVRRAPFSFADYDAIHVCGELYRKHRVHYLLYIVLRGRMTGRFFVDLYHRSNEAKVASLFDEGEEEEEAAAGSVAGSKFEGALTSLLVQLTHTRLASVHRGSSRLLKVYMGEVRRAVRALVALVPAAAATARK